MPDAAAKITCALRVVMMPRDANVLGTIFGGVILSYIDQAGFIEARRHGVHRWVTVSMDQVEFNAPVFMGDIVEFRTSTLRTGTSSVQVQVEVLAERYTTGDIVPVTAAAVTMVSINAAGKPIPYNTAPTVHEVTGFGADA